MLTIPFELLSCSWPHPMGQRDGRWESEPEWDAPPAPLRPQPIWTLIDGEPVWLIDWCALFRAGGMGWGEMRGFHVVFRIRIEVDGRFAFWADDGCIIRRGGQVVFEDRWAHRAARAELQVARGEVLEIAQWQLLGEWVWGARAADESPGDPAQPFRQASPAVRDRLLRPEGPPVKIFTSGGAPLRAVLAIYSLVLNGYSPSGVLLYGGDQWSSRARDLFDELLPFARRMDPDELVLTARALGGPQLADMARRYWWVGKACAALLDPTAEFALIDDDVVVLDRVDDALAAFASHDLVFTPDNDWTGAYLQMWSAASGVADLHGNGLMNAGLYWGRHAFDPWELARIMVRVPPEGQPAHFWEQGLIAATYAARPCFALSPQRYLFPVRDGLPGGMIGYDYQDNPCRFASVHFAALAKPCDVAAGLIAARALARAGAAHAQPAHLPWVTS